MALTIMARGYDETITATGPGVLVSQTITVTGMAATDTEVITNQSSSADSQGENKLYVSSKASNSFVVASERPQLLNDVEIDFIVITGTA